MYGIRKSKGCVDLATAHAVGKQMLVTLNAAGQHGATSEYRDHVGGSLYRHCVVKLEESVRLTKERRISIVREFDAEAKMYEDSPQEAERFLMRWRRARFMMYKEGLDLG